MPVLCSADPLHPDCFEKYPRRKIDTHRRVCRWRMTPCVFVCGELFYDKRAMTLHVEQQCPNRTVNCLHCDVQHQARDRDRHLLTCPRAIIPCPHQAALGMAAGCTVRVERRDLPLHLRQCRFEDMKDVLRGVRIHLNSMLRRQRAAERRHKAELRRITTLTLHSGDLHDAGQLRGLLRFNPAIRALNAYDFQPGTSWVHLTEVLQDGNWPIHTLNLQGSVIEKTGAVLLAKALRTNKRIRHLNLTDNAVGDQGVEFLTKAFMDSKLR
ncbi:hypothetical protein BDF22DRAFT_135129 [Syncephalis plumigaleata]|nr:hypothetical protein BDF22DRAFT_135129 [Syncephalis plumigaleata]